ncbi:MAG: inositol monophosphatase family protein [Cypionkella sp.]
MDLQPRYDLCLDLIQEAGRLAQGYFRNLGALTIKSKGVQDMVSEADLNTELLIKGRLAEVFPQDAFLGEETGVSAFAPGQGIWVVDPIDGTQPFISGMSNWCVSIAFVCDDVVQFGMVFAPERDELFAGGRGFPATLNGNPVTRHPGKSLRDGITGMGYSTRIAPEAFLRPFEGLLREGGMFFRDGSGALNLSYVAAGRLLGYYEPHINSWDCLGAIAVIEAAGLRVNDFLANDGLTKGNPIIAGIPEVYDDLVRLSKL